MAIRHTDQHDADVCRALGVVAGGDSALAGIEIETGWQTESKRTAFFKELERRGIPADKCISKHDGTIGSRGETYPAEIVSAPLPFDELRKFTERVGRAIETLADKGLITTGAGVHIHVSEGLLPADALWRYAAAICQDKGFVLKHNRTGNMSSIVAQARSLQVHKFWDDVCLRGQGPYNRRIPYNKTDQIRKTVDHQRAFIHGRATPTYETRIFRTSKSRQVLASYVDVVESLLRFSLDPGGADLIETEGRPMTLEAYEELKRIAAPVLYPFTRPDTGETVYVDYEWGDQFAPTEVTRVEGLRDFVPSEEYLRAIGRRVLSPDERLLIEQMQHDKGALGWIDGTVPLTPYLKFVTDNEKAFPFLTARLGYDKFASYFGKAPTVPEYPHREEKHLEFKPGCVVRMENGRGALFCLNQIVNISDSPIKSARLRYLETGIEAQPCPVNTLIHACKGALSPCGEV